MGKITGGASGTLQQEFHELKLLDDITTLRFNGKLPRNIAMAKHRNPMIGLFREYRGSRYVPCTAHNAVRWSKADPFLEWEEREVSLQVVDKKSDTNLKSNPTLEAPPTKDPPSALLESFADKLQLMIPNFPQGHTVKKRKPSHTSMATTPMTNLKRLTFNHEPGPSEYLQLDVPIGT
ncbi:hypothetical protein L208DRAFT_1319840 [Tricholoma matsutake]|nr:hypothetical protein L208DRAFT_1319840 [Tricholoma matsutake 945]